MHQAIGRRRFLKHSRAALLACPWAVRAGARTPPSERIRVAHIGTGGMGKQHIRWFSGFPDVETVALCDVDSVRLAEGAQLLVRCRPEAKPQTYGDFRRVLERKDIDVVTCATPDHWHALVAIQAFEAGKDVYGEKPLSFSLREGQRMEQTMRRTQAVFQLGTQIHAGDNYHRVAEIIRSGALGKISTVRLWKTGGTHGLGFPPSSKPPATLDWNLWLGPAPYAEYTPVRCHGTFRSFFDYSGGVFADFWCHIADVLFLALDPTGLTTIDARGEVPADGIADTPKWIDVDFRFAGLDVHWTTAPPPVPGAAGMTIGAHFEGEKGTLTCDYDTRTIRIGNDVLADLPDVPVTLPRSPGHQRNFLDAVRNRGLPESNLPYARKLTLPMHLALASFRLKRRLAWDNANEVVVGDPAANYLLDRTQRVF